MKTEEIKQLIKEQLETLQEEGYLTNENGKVTITFNLDNPHAKRNFETMMKSQALVLALWDVTQRVWRPAYKHGYEDSDLQDLLDNYGQFTAQEYKKRFPSEECYSYGEPEDTYTTSGYEIIEKLRTIFYEILEEHDINLDQLVY